MCILLIQMVNTQNAVCIEQSGDIVKWVFIDVCVEVHRAVQIVCHEAHSAVLVGRPPRLEGHQLFLLLAFQGNLVGLALNHGHSFGKSFVNCGFVDREQ